MKILILVSILILTSCDGRFDHGPTIQNLETTEFVSNGERIYFTGRSASGSPIISNGGIAPLNMHMRMHDTGCVTCHGTKREGLRLWPQLWIKAPALTIEALFANETHKDETDDHGHHESYDDETLRRAIISGIGPADDQLDIAMPRWSMNRSDLNDLIAYLKQSHDHK